MPPLDALDEAHLAKMNTDREILNKDAKPQQAAYPQEHEKASMTQNKAAAQEKQGVNKAGATEEEHGNRVPFTEEANVNMGRATAEVQETRKSWWGKLLFAAIWCVYGSWLIGLAFRVMSDRAGEDGGASRGMQFAKFVVEILCWASIVQARTLLKWCRRIFQGEPQQEN